MVWLFFVLVGSSVYPPKKTHTQEERTKHHAKKKVKTLKKLDLSNFNISSVEAIQDFKLLKELDLSNNYIRDVSSLKNMRKLKSLDLENNCIDDARSENLSRDERGSG